MATDSITVTTEGPVYIITLAEQLTLAEWQTVVDTFAKRLSEQPKCVVIFDAYELKSYPPEARKLVVNWRKANAHRYAEGLYGLSYVVKSPLIRAAFQALLLLARPPVPFAISATRAGAVQWARTLIERSRQS
jgi:hypothetical protein